MTQYETIKKVRNVIKMNGGLTKKQIALVLRAPTNAIGAALEVMGDAYVDRWNGKEPVYDLIEKPEPCPRPH